MTFPNDKIASHLANVPRSGIRDFFDLVETRQDVLSLGIGEPDFVTPWRIRDAAVYALDHGATSYTANLGLMSLRREISRYVKSAFKMAYDPATEILVTVGVSEAFDLAIRAVVSPGDEVIYHEPCYVSYGPVVTFAHGVPVAVSTRREDDFRLTPETVEAAVTGRSKVLVLNFPTNPTGATLDRADLEAIAEIARRHDLIVIADEIYSELTYEGERGTIAALDGMRERTIFLHGLSKAWAMTGFRIGYACAVPELTEAMMKIHQYTMLCAPVLSQMAALEALKHTESLVEGMKSDYEKRRNVMHAAFKEMGMPCLKPRGAFYMFPYVGDTGLTSHEFCIQLLEAENVACVPGTAFGASGEGHIRCSYATEMDRIREAMERMGRFVGNSSALRR
jgi:aminotransferase